MENHDDFHTSEDGYIHTQDQQGVYIIYDVALEDLKEAKYQLLLVASQYTEKDKSKISTGPKHCDNLVCCFQGRLILRLLESLLYFHRTKF